MYKKNVIRLILVIYLFLFCFNLYSQSNFTYSYDASGNQTQRIYEVMMVANKVSKNINNSNIDTTSVVVIKEKLKITIFPNPTKGELKVDISGIENEANVDLSLFSPKGQLLLKQNATQGLTTINMHGFPAGWYLLKAQSGNTLLNFKIVKD